MKDKAELKAIVRARVEAREMAGVGVKVLLFSVEPAQASLSLPAKKNKGFCDKHKVRLLHWHNWKP